MEAARPHLGKGRCRNIWQGWETPNEQMLLTLGKDPWWNLWLLTCAGSGRRQQTPPQREAKPEGQCYIFT